MFLNLLINITFESAFVMYYFQNVVLNWALGWTSVAFIILYSIMEGLFFSIVSATQSCFLGALTIHVNFCSP